MIGNHVLKKVGEIGINYDRGTIKWKHLARKPVPGNLIPQIYSDPFDTIAIDILGPLPLTHNQNRYIVVCSDYATRWIMSKKQLKQ